MKYGKTKVRVWRVLQAVWGADSPAVIFFRTKEERDEYYDTHNYCDKLRPITLDLLDEYGGRNFYFEDELKEFVGES